MPDRPQRTSRTSRLAHLSLPNILGSLLLALAWLLPGHYLPWTLFQQEWVAALAGLMLCWAAVQARAPTRWPILARVAVLLAILPWLQFMVGQVRFIDDALLSSCYLLALALAIVVAASLAGTPIGPQLREGLTAAFVGASILAAGMALYQWFDLPAVGDWLEGRPPWARPYANLAQPNHLASVLALGAAGTVRWFHTRRIGPATCLLTLAWLAWGIVITQSRTGWLFVATLSFGYLLMHRRAQLRASRWLPVALAMGFGALVWAHGPLQALWQVDPFTSAATSPRTEVGTRPTHWRLLGDAALQSPLFGYGFNQVSHAQSALALEHPASGENVMQSHNLLLDLAIYAGIPVATGVVLLLAAWLARGLWRCREGESWCLWAGLVALLLHAMLEYPLHYAYFLLPAGFLIGTLHAPGGGLWAAPTWPRWTLATPALALAVMLAWIGLEYMRTEEALRRLRFAHARIGETRLEDLKSPDVHLLRGWKAYHDATRLKLTAGMRAEDLDLLRDVARRYTYAPALHRLAQALVMNGQPEEARRALMLICKIHPPPLADAVRDLWAERQAQEPLLRTLDFPDCAHGATARP